jgi:hypothetical protein
MAPALIKLGRLAEAADILTAIGAPHPSLAPLLHWRRALLALAEGDRPQAMQQAAAMATSLESTSSTLPELRIMGPTTWRSSGRN